MQALNQAWGVDTTTATPCTEQRAQYGSPTKPVRGRGRRPAIRCGSPHGRRMRPAVTHNRAAVSPERIREIRGGARELRGGVRESAEVRARELEELLVTKQRPSSVPRLNFTSVRILCVSVLLHFTVLLCCFSVSQQ